MNNSDAILIDREDAEALAQFIYEHLQYDDDNDAQFWQSILNRLLSSLNP